MRAAGLLLFDHHPTGCGVRIGLMFRFLLSRQISGHSAALAIASTVAALFLGGCVEGEEAASVETMYGARQVVELRSELDPDSEIVGRVGLGEPLALIERRRSLIRGESANGVVGWARESELISEDDRQAMGRMAELAKAFPGQGEMGAFDVLNVHLEPYRWSVTIYQLAQDEPVQLLRRRAAARVPEGSPRSQAEQNLGLPVDDWSLVRFVGGDVGWVLSSRIYPAIPVEVAQYAEGRRIVSYAAIGEVADESLGVSKTTWLWTQTSKSGLEYDFDRIRIFQWNARGDGYRTVHLRTGLRGYLPVEIIPDLDSPHGRGVGFSYVAEADGTRSLMRYVLVGQRVYEIGEAAAPPAVQLDLPSPPTPAAAPSPGFLDRVRQALERLVG